MIKKVVFAFDEASQTLIDSLDAEIVELVDGRRLILPKLHGATECAPTQRARDVANTWRCKCAFINSDRRSVCYGCGSPRP